MSYRATTKREFEKDFRQSVLSGVRKLYEENGRIDYPARREAWNDYIDLFVKDGDLPPKAMDWVCPW